MDKVDIYFLISLIRKLSKTQYLDPLRQGSQTFSLEGELVNIFSFVAHVISNAKAATENMQKDDHDCD